MALDNLVSETLLDEAADNAGIQTSGSQLSFYILENPVNPRIQEIMQQLNASGMSVSTPQQAYEVIFNPKRNGLTDAPDGAVPESMGGHGGRDKPDDSSSDLSASALWHNQGKRP